MIHGVATCSFSLLTGLFFVCVAPRTQRICCSLDRILEGLIQQSSFLVCVACRPQRSLFSYIAGLIFSE